jgi:hypothetical protein
MSNAVALFAVFAAVAAASTVHQFSAQQFVSMTAGRPVAGVDADTDAFHGQRHHGVWAVRYCLPWECEDATDETTNYGKAAEQVDASLARFAEVKLDSVEAFALADAQGIAEFPAIKVYHTNTGRPDVTKGANVSPRHISFPQEVKQKDVKGIVNGVLGVVPSLYADHLTSAVRPSAALVDSDKQMVKQADAHRAAYRVEQDGQEAANPWFVTVVAQRKDVQALAASYAAGAMLRGRGGTAVFNIDAGDAPTKWLPKDKKAGIAVVTWRLSRDGTKADTADVTVNPDADVTAVVAAVFAAGSATTSFADDDKARAAIADETNKGAHQLLAPATKTSFPLRRIDTTSQFRKEVADLKGGAAVVFMLRETDPFYGQHLGMARDVAAAVLKDSTVTIENQEGNDQQIHMTFSPFVIDAEAHRDVAKALKVKGVPSFFVAVEMQKGHKGVKYFPGGFTAGSLKKMIKFIRGDAFASKGMETLDCKTIVFGSPPLASKKDLTLRTEVFSANPRRFGDGTLAQGSKALENLVQLGHVSKKAAKKMKKLTPKEQRKADKKAAKAESANDAAKEKMDKLKKEKEERIAAKAAAEKAAAEAKKAALKAKAAKQKAFAKTPAGIAKAKLKKEKEAAFVSGKEWKQKLAAAQKELKSGAKPFSAKAAAARWKKDMAAGADKVLTFKKAAEDGKPAVADINDDLF